MAANPTSRNRSLRRAGQKATGSRGTPRMKKGTESTAEVVTEAKPKPDRYVFPTELNLGKQGKLAQKELWLQGGAERLYVPSLPLGNTGLAAQYRVEDPAPDQGVAGWQRRSGSARA